MIREVKWLPILFFVGSILLLIPIFIFPSDWAGWVLVYFSFVIPLLFDRVRRDRKLLLILFAITAVHNAVSIYNVYGSTVFGATLDAMTFQELSKDLALNKYPLWFTEFEPLEIGTNVYTRFLATFYRAFGVSLLLGQSLSVIAYNLSCIVLVYLTASFHFRFKRVVMLFYAFPAPAIIYCSITMREAWQVLFFLLLIYLTIQLRNSPSILKTISMILSGLALGLLHNGLFVYSLILVGISLYWGASGRWKTVGYKKVLIRTAILGGGAITFILWIYLGGEIGGAAKAIRSGETTSYAEQYRERGEQDAAASYQVRIDSSSILAFISSGTTAFIYYQFAPFPWLVRRTIDIYATFEALLRLVFMGYMFKLWWKARSERRQRYGYLILCYLSLEFLWSLGTANWGTSARHHVIAYGILVLMGAPGFAYSFERLLLRLKFRVRKPIVRRSEMKRIGAVS